MRADGYPLSKYDKTVVQNFVRNVGRLEALGKGHAEIQSATVLIRDFHDHFEGLWNCVRLAGEPEIEANALKIDPVPPSLTIMLFGGDDPPPLMPGGVSQTDWVTALLKQSGVDIPDTTYVSLAAGTTSIIFGQTNEEVEKYASGEATDFQLEYMKFSTYWAGTIAAHSGVLVSRFDVVEYASYALGYVHSLGDRYKKRSPIQSALFAHLDAIEPVFRRGNIDYMLLSIRDEILAAPDLKVFLERAGQFISQA